jgi:hypothetical protein
MSRYSPGLRFRHFLTILLKAAGRFCALLHTVESDYLFNAKAHGLGFLRSPFAQAYPRPTAVFINKLNARSLERAANRQIVGCRAYQIWRNEIHKRIKL